MPWSSGTFTRTDGTRTGSTTWAQAKAAAVKIVAADHDTHDQDLATGINNCLTKDGQNSPTANIPMGSFKLTGLAAGSSAGESVRYEQSAIGVLTTSGDILYLNSSGDLARLAIGGDGQQLSVDSGALTWNTPASISTLFETTETKTADDTLTGTDDKKFFFMDDTSADVDLTLPDASTVGAGFIVGGARVATGGNTVRFSRAGSDTIGDGDANRTLNSITDTCILISDGDSTWIDVSTVRQMIGDSGSGGRKGLVPAPSSGDAASGYALLADATWGTPTIPSGTVTNAMLSSGAMAYSQLVAVQTLPAATEDEVTSISNFMNAEEIVILINAASLGSNGDFDLDFGDGTDYSTGNTYAGTTADESGVSVQNWVSDSVIGLGTVLAANTLVGRIILRRMPDAMAVSHFGASNKAWQVDVMVNASNAVTTDRISGSGFFSTTKTVDRMKLIGGSNFDNGTWSVIYR